MVAIRWDDLEFGELDDTDLWWAALAAEPPHVAAPFLSLVDAARPAWHTQAACRDRPDLDWFSAADQAATTAICAHCPAAGPCGEAGRREPFGVWGGQARRLDGAQTRRMAAGEGPVARMPRQGPRPCSHCESAPARAHGLCVNCYQYRRWSGRDRPETLIVAENLRKHETEVERGLVRDSMLWAEAEEERRRARRR